MIRVVPILLALVAGGAVAGPVFIPGSSTPKKVAPAQAAAPAIKVLQSGVQVEHLQKGSGTVPTADNSVTVHYRGTLVLGGAEFDSSYRRGRPATFPLRQVIPCWTEGMQRIAAGGKAVLVCPAHTAYGARGAGAGVPPDAELRFEVELLNVQ